MEDEVQYWSFAKLAPLSREEIDSITTAFVKKLNSLVDLGQGKSIFSGNELGINDRALSCDLMNHNATLYFKGKLSLAIPFNLPDVLLQQVVVDYQKMRLLKFETRNTSEISIIAAMRFYIRYCTSVNTELIVNASIDLVKETLVPAFDGPSTTTLRRYPLISVPRSLRYLDRDITMALGIFGTKESVQLKLIF
ncbi:MAG: hypothetical protein HQK50_06440 [Oligoflexia bacterium]|nr:hypothetical protein [Oligoflexia bacterium]